MEWSFTSVNSDIKTALAEIHSLVRDEFAKVGGVAPPESALDQAGLLDGDQIVLYYLAHNEAGVALDHLIYMAHELHLPLSPQTYECIVRAGKALRMKPEQWSCLRIAPR